MSKMWLLRHKKGRSSHNCCLYQFFKIYFENKILKNENFDHPEKNELFCLQTNLFVKNSFYMTINYNRAAGAVADITLGHDIGRWGVRHGTSFLLRIADLKRI